MDTVADPVGWEWAGFDRLAVVHRLGALGATAHLAQWQEAENSSIDFYSFLRSSWYQTRRGQLREALGLPPQTESPATADR